MHFKVRSLQGASIIRLEGDFISEVDQEKLRKRVRELAQSGNIHIILDLERVKYINSCGLGSLVCALTVLRKAGGDIRLAGVGSVVHDLLQITQLDKILQIFSSVEEALGAQHLQESGD